MNPKISLTLKENEVYQIRFNGEISIHVPNYERQQINLYFKRKLQERHKSQSNEWIT
jgi:hypothetical protein